MLEYNQIKPGKIIVFNGEPYTVLSSHVFRKQQRKPVNQTKLKNLITEKVIENSFGSSEKVKEAMVEKKHVTYLFHKFNRQQNAEEYWFSSVENRGDRFSLNVENIGDSLPFLKENEEIDIILFGNTTIGVELPIKITLEVTEAPPNIKGSTASGGDKQVTLETGATVIVPMFIETGEKIVINTQTGEYVERAK